MRANEVPQVGEEKLSNRDGCRTGEQAADSEGRESTAFLQLTEDGPFPEINLIANAREAQTSVGIAIRARRSDGRGGSGVAGGMCS